MPLITQPARESPVIDAGDESAVPFGGVMGWEHTLGHPMRERHLRPVSTRSRRGKVPLSRERCAQTLHLHAREVYIRSLHVFFP